MQKNKFWNIKKASETNGEITIYGDIGDSWWGDSMSASAFAQELKSLDGVKNIDIYINSPGGDAFAGIAIYNMLKRSTAHTTAHIDGLAASAASIIAMGADDIVMPHSASIMIHKAWCLVAGNADELSKLVGELDKMDEQLASIYSEKTGKDVSEILAMMEAETWMNGTEAVQMGFATSLNENKIAAYCRNMDLSKFKNVPKNIQEQLVVSHSHIISIPEQGENEAFKGINDAIATNAELLKQALDKLNDSSSVTASADVEEYINLDLAKKRQEQRNRTLRMEEENV